MMAWKNVVLSRAEQKNLKREALLREAAAAINRKGFHATSLEDIATSLGVSKATLYYYFPNKQKLLAACFEKVMEAAFESLDEAKRTAPNGREKLRMALQLYLRRMIDEMSCCVIVTEEHSMLAEDRVPHVAARDHYEAEIRSLVQEGIADGSIVPCDPKLVTFAVLGAIHWVPKWFSNEGEWTSTQLSTAIMELLERAISARPASRLAERVSALPR
jgi:TetR/AcrR family transcriptional regulator